MAAARLRASRFRLRQAGGQTAGQWQESQRYPDPRIEILDPSFAQYRINSAKVERLATGMRWAEGPVWFGDGRYLLWSDIPNNRIMKWEEETGAVSVFRKPSNFSNGNTRDRQGRLLTCEHDTRRVTRTEYDGSITVLAERFEGKPLNSPNDIVCRSDGSIWFTDPPFGILGNYEGHVAKPELPTNVYRLDPATSRLEVVAGDIARPNGLCFSPDERRLYVIEAGVTPRVIRVYDVAGGSKLSNGARADHGAAQRHARRHALRRGRESLDRLGNGKRDARWRLRVQRRRQADRPHQRSRTGRQRVLRRRPPQPPVHGGQHVGVLAVREYAGGLSHLNSQLPIPNSQRISSLEVGSWELEVVTPPNRTLSRPASR